MPLMLWIKAFHIIFVASWFSGLFYLPRIFVNLAMVPTGSPAERERLLLMGRKLMRFTTILMIPALLLGLTLWLYYGVGAGAGWMHAKLVLIALALGYHHLCGRLLRQFERGENTRPHTWYRYFNESAVLMFAAAVILVVVKPF
jgi:protoporphyrinogen IX oxidase